MNNLMLKVEQDDFYSAASVAAQNLIKNLTKDNVVKDLEKQLYEWSVEGKSNNYTEIL